MESSPPPHTASPPALSPVEQLAHAEATAEHLFAAARAAFNWPRGKLMTRQEYVAAIMVVSSTSFF